MIVRMIKDRMYQKRIMLIYGDRYDKVNAYLVKRFGKKVERFDEDEQGGMLEVMHKRRKYFILWLERINKSPRDLGYLAHEVLHLTFIISQYLGFKINAESDEPICYYHQYLFENIIKVI